MGACLMQSGKASQDKSFVFTCLCIYRRDMLNEYHDANTVFCPVHSVGVGGCFFRPKDMHGGVSGGVMQWE